MRRESGDTLVEVLIATALLGAAVVGGLGIMNFGFGAILNSIERTQVQASMNSQLSFIQYARDAYVRAGRQGTEPGGPKLWSDIVANATSSYSANVCNASGAPDTDASKRPFYIEIRNDGSTPPQKIAEFVPMTVFPVPAATAAPTAGDGLWVEAVQPTGTNYIDFYVKACWSPIAGVSNQASRSVMRLYNGEAVVVAAGTPTSQPPCSNLDSYAANFIRNGTFATSAGNGPGIAPTANFESDLPNRGSDVYPDDVGVNGTAGYTGGFSLQHGDKTYFLNLGATTLPLTGRAFGGDPARGVPASNTWFYSNPNQRASDPPGTLGPFVGRLWKQQISGLQAGASYDFSGYFDNLLPTWYTRGADPQIQLRVNSVPQMASFAVLRSPDIYQRITFVFTMPTSYDETVNGPVVLDIYDVANDIDGDDFGMTSLALRRCV